MPRVALLLALAACRPGLTDKDPADDPRTDDEPAPEDTDRPDTDLVGRCDLTETEPNDDEAQANALPMEATACGGFHRDADGDFWRFEMPEEGWLAVDVPGFSIGSEAWISLTLSAPSLPPVVGFRDGERREVRLRFPSPRATWTGLVRQQVGPGVPRGEGDDHFYELRASSTKAPVDWDVEETENDRLDAPQRLITGDGGSRTVRVLGGLEHAGDVDVYDLTVPGPGHVVTLALVAEAEGSNGDFVITLHDAAGAVVEQVPARASDAMPDPALTVVPVGADRIVLRVAGRNGQYGPATWYLLTVDVEAP